ncbi:MAG: type II secretion system protein [Candidatus Nanosyncoccaceae bacterium]|jgi:prepilin-type N-terminal cleavage/methylation domain-containing protein
MKAIVCNSKLRGFTVIEVVLVLAITGLMAVSALLGVRGSINNQRYSDSVNSFRDFLRNQYNNVTSTDIATRDLSISNYCGGISQRGRTNCLVLGRLLRFEPDGETVSIYDVIGTEELTGHDIPSDETYFQSNMINLRVVGITDHPPGADKTSNPTPKEVYRLDWDAKVKHSNGGSPSKYVLIIRSPISGSVRTYAMMNDGPNGKNLDKVLIDLVQTPHLSDQNLKYQPVFCVHPEGFSLATRRRAVIIKPNGSNASAVEIAPLDGIVNGVEAVACN